MDAAGNTYNYNKKEILEKGLSLDNTKAIEASAQTIEANTNIPIHRVVRKTQNMQGALDYLKCQETMQNPMPDSYCFCGGKEFSIKEFL